MPEDAELRLARVRACLDGWEARDRNGHQPCSIERGTADDGSLEIIVEGLTYEQQGDVMDFLHHLYALCEGFASATSRNDPEVDRFTWGRPGEVVSLDSVRGTHKDEAS